MRKVPETHDDITLPWLNLVFEPHNLKIHKFTWEGAVGEGYGCLSLLRRLTLVYSESTTLPDDNNNTTELSSCPTLLVTKTLSTVVKMLPANADLRKIIISEGFSQREFQMYTKVFPLWNEFLDSQNTPQEQRFRHPTCYYGAEEEDGEDYRMILIMEDMRSSNFVSWTPGFKQGLRLNEAKKVIRQMALFHACGMTYKIHNKIADYNQEYPFLYEKSKDKVSYKHYLKIGVQRTIDMLEFKRPDSLPVPEGLIEDLKTMENDSERIRNFEMHREGDAGTVCHHDLHVHNIMLPNEANKSDKVALLDYQVCLYSSPMNDLSFFLMLNCHQTLFTTHYNQVLEYYHEIFTSACKSIGVEVSYPLEKMIEEYEHYQFISIIHIIMGAPYWCFGRDADGEVSWKRLTAALIDTYNRRGGSLRIYPLEN